MAAVAPLVAPLADPRRAAAVLTACQHANPIAVLSLSVRFNLCIAPVPWVESQSGPFMDLPRVVTPVKCYPFGLPADKFATCQSCSAPVELGDTPPAIQNATDADRKWTFRIVVGVPAVLAFVTLCALRCPGLQSCVRDAAPHTPQLCALVCPRRAGIPFFTPRNKLRLPLHNTLRVYVPVCDVRLVHQQQRCRGTHRAMGDVRGH
jgi:hypothetical protein